jgi:acetyl-CoA carboxylase carboxyl transferase subunit beta
LALADDKKERKKADAATRAAEKAAAKAAKEAAKAAKAAAKAEEEAARRAAKEEAKAAKAAAEAQVDDEDSSEGGGLQLTRRFGRLGRLRLNKKKDMPGGLWLKCESCDEVVYRKDLEEKGRVCPACSFHFTLPGPERVRMLLDEGTWNERHADIEALDRLSFVDKVPYSQKIKRTAERLDQNEALLCGDGKILGRPVALGVLDFSFMGGSMGEVVGEKIALITDHARAEGLPLILFTSSGGARMHEGILSLMQMAKTCSALADFGDAGGFSICVMTHPTTGGVTASFASVCDITLAEPGALIGFAGPRVIATTLRQELPPGFQRAEFLLERGMIDAIVERSNLREALAGLIGYAAGPLG